MFGDVSTGPLLKMGVVGLLAAISCGGGSCGGGGCGGCGDTGYQFPQNDPARPDAIVQDEVLRVRITQDFLDFVKPQLPELIAGQFAGQGGGMYVDQNNILHIPLPNIDIFDIGIAEARLRNAEALLWLDDMVNNVDIQFEEPSLVRITISDMRIGIDARIKENIAGTTSSCPIEGNLGPLPPGMIQHAATISIEATIDPGVGPDPDYPLDVQVDVADISIGAFDIDVAGSSTYCQEPECQDCLLEPFGTCLDPGGRCAECRIFCGLVTDAVVDVATAFIDLLLPLLNNLLTPVVEGLLGDALNDLNGTSAKVETQVALGDLVGIDALKAAKPFGIFAAPTPGRFPVNNRGTGLGMEVTVNAGAEAELADCIEDLGAFVPNPGPVPDPSATDSMGRPFHMWAGFSSSYLNQLLDAIHRSGSLCIKLGSEDIQELSGFSINATLLSILASDLTKVAEDRAPAILEVKPRRAARVELGSGALVGQDSMGNDIYDWLLKLAVEDLGIAFHVLIHDRYVRIFEVTIDAFVGLNINVLPDNSLEIAVGEIRIDDFQETFNELLPNADFADALPTLLDVVLGTVLNQQLTFDVDLTDAVSDALGVPLALRINDIYRDGVQEDYLTMTMTFTASMAGNLSLLAPTQARLHVYEPDLVRPELDFDPESFEKQTMVPTGHARLEVGTSLPYSTQRELEYQTRVDGGLWRVAQRARPDNTLVLNDPKLRLPGRHMVEVRARFIGNYKSLDPTPERFLVIVDPEPPRLKTRMADEGLQVTVVDELTDDLSTLSLLVRAPGDSWRVVDLSKTIDGATEALISYAELAGVDALELMARDSSGNQSPIASVRLGLEAAGGATATSEQGCACHDVGVQHSHNEGASILVLALLAGFLLLRRRKNS